MCIRDRPEAIKASFYEKAAWLHPDRHHGQLDDRTHGQLVVLYARIAEGYRILSNPCLLYTSDAADERSSVDLGGRRIIQKKKHENTKKHNRDHLAT